MVVINGGTIVMRGLQLPISDNLYSCWDMSAEVQVQAEAGASIPLKSLIDSSTPPGIDGIAGVTTFTPHGLSNGQRIVTSGFDKTGSAFSKTVNCYTTIQNAGASSFDFPYLIPHEQNVYFVGDAPDGVAAIPESASLRFPDLSGNSRDIIKNVAGRGIYPKAVRALTGIPSNNKATFQSSIDLSKTPGGLMTKSFGTLAQPYTIYMAHEYELLAASQVFMTTIDGTALYAGIFGVTVFNFGTPAIGPAQTNNFHVLAIVVDGASSKARLNDGSSVSLTNLGTNSLTDFVIHTTAEGQAFSDELAFGKMAIYSGTHTDDETLLTNQYIMSEWGIS